MGEHKIEITVCDNGYYLKSSEGDMAFGDGDWKGVHNEYSPSLKELINYLLHVEFMEDNGNKHGKLLVLTEENDG